MKKTTYYEYLRIMATIAVVMIHVAMCLPNNYSIEELGIHASAVMNSTYLLVNWAVPVFIMISGALLLTPNKVITYSKIFHYVLRMGIVLLLFGGGYAMIELYVTERRISITLLFGGLVNMLQGKSWSHMWYLYMLIGLYLVTIPLRQVIQSSSRRQLEILLGILVAGNFIIQTVNVSFSLELENYMQWGHYITYYLLGYYLSVVPLQSIPRMTGAIVFVAVSAFRFGLDYLWITRFHEISGLAQEGRVLILSQAAALFLFARQNLSHKPLNRISSNISRCSFTIYLIHPVFGNVFFKVIDFTPLSFPSRFLGILVITAVLFGLSWAVATVMIRIPYLKKVI